MKPLLWADCETTGLDPTTASLLEIALVATDENLEVEDKISLVLAYQGFPESNKVRKMHTDNGLFAECNLSQFTTEDVDEELTAWVMEDGYVNRPLAGTNPDFDRRFIVRHLPHLAGVFHYRNFDLNSLRFFLNFERKDKEKDKTLRHRALPDLERDISFAKEMRRIYP